MFRPDYTPVVDSLRYRAPVAAVPLLVRFVPLGGLRIKAPIAAAAVRLQGKEGDPFRSALGWGMLPLLLMCVPVHLQTTPVLGWMAA